MNAASDKDGTNKTNIKHRFLENFPQQPATSNLTCKLVEGQWEMETRNKKTGVFIDEFLWILQHLETGSGFTRENHSLWDVFGKKITGSYDLTRQDINLIGKFPSRDRTSSIISSFLKIT